MVRVRVRVRLEPRVGFLSFGFWVARVRASGGHSWCGFSYVLGCCGVGCRGGGGGSGGGTWGLGFGELGCSVVVTLALMAWCGFGRVAPARLGPLDIAGATPATIWGGVVVAPGGRGCPATCSTISQTGNELALALTSWGRCSRSYPLARAAYCAPFSP